MLLFVTFFFFNDTATTEIYTLSLHDALPISSGNRIRRATKSARQIGGALGNLVLPVGRIHGRNPANGKKDRKSTRLNSSHGYISYAVFCLKKKKHFSPHSSSQ